MKKIIHIQGMHCISCEIILEKELKKISNVSLLMINHKKGIMEIEYEDDISYKKVVQAIEKHNFSVSEKKQKSKLTLNVILNHIALYLGLGILIYMFSLLDLYKYLPDTSTLSYSGAFLVGIIASISTCLAVTGGIIIGFSRYVDHEKGLKGHIKIQGLFQLGRIIGFFIMGGILGEIGGVFQIHVGLTGILTFVVGFLLLYMGLNIIGLFPSITKFGLHLPKGFANKIENISNPKFAPIVGALTFFLPCGFTQTLQLLAVSSGSFLVGGLIMLAFTLGTFPVLFTVGLGSSYFKGKKFPFVNKMIGIVVILMGIFTLSNSSNLLSISNNASQQIVVEKNQGVENLGEGEEINISHNGWSTEPAITRLKAGGNYRIIVTPTSNGLGCMSTQVIPKLSNKVSYVKAGEPIIYEMNNAKKGTYDVVCASMGMNQGKIIVE